MLSDKNKSNLTAKKHAVNNIDGLFFIVPTHAPHYILTFKNRASYI